MHQRPNGVPACASCKHQRKKCKEDCMMAQFFPIQRNREFLAVHKIFGVSNVGKQLKKHNNEEHRRSSADSLIWEASCWEKDPIHGPYGEYNFAIRQLRDCQSQCRELTLKLQEATSKTYNPSAAAAMEVVPISPRELMNGSSWNNNGGITAINPSSAGGITMMENVLGGTLNSVSDFRNRNFLASPYTTNNHHQDLDSQNISGAVGNIPQHQHQHQHQQQQQQLSNIQMLQSMENQLRERDRTNGVILPMQHHNISCLNHPCYNNITAGNYNASPADHDHVKNSKNSRIAESSRWPGNS